MRNKNRTVTPHFGVRNNLTRKGHVVTGDKFKQSFKSIRCAKRFMRTGKENRQ